MKLLNKIRAAYYYMFKQDKLERPWEIRTAHLSAVNNLNPLTGKYQDKPWDWSQMPKPQLELVDNRPVKIELGK